jgi:hypothetical protein
VWDQTGCVGPGLRPGQAMRSIAANLDERNRGPLGRPTGSETRSDMGVSLHHFRDSHEFVAFRLEARDQPIGRHDRV